MFSTCVDVVHRLPSSAVRSSCLESPSSRARMSICVLPYDTKLQRRLARNRPTAHPPTLSNSSRAVASGYGDSDSGGGEGAYRRVVGALRVGVSIDVLLPEDAPLDLGQPARHGWSLGRAPDAPRAHQSRTSHLPTQAPSSGFERRAVKVPKMPKTPVNTRVSAPPQGAGAAGLEPATPGFGDRCSAS
jgi:hypothetical protein